MDMNVSQFMQIRVSKQREGVTVQFKTGSKKPLKHFYKL
jgi:hypothetical protein